MRFSVLLPFCLVTCLLITREALFFFPVNFLPYQVASQSETLRHEIERLGQEGKAAGDKGNQRAAEAKFEQMLQKVDRLNDPVLGARHYNNIGTFYYKTEQYSKAKRKTEQALAYAERLGAERHDKWRAVLLMNLASICFLLEQYKESLRYEQENLSLREKLQDKDGIMHSLTNISALTDFVPLGENPLSFYNHALALRRQYGTEEQIAYGRFELGAEYLKRRDYARAQEEYQAALPILETNATSEAQRIVAGIRNDLGVIAMQTGALDSAQEYLKQALTLFTAQTNLNVSPDILNNFTELGNIYARTNAPEKARVCYETAIAAYERLRTSIVDPAHIAAFQDTFRNPYTAYALLEYRAGHLHKALAIADQGRGHSLRFLAFQAMAGNTLDAKARNTWHIALSRMIATRKERNEADRARRLVPPDKYFQVEKRAQEAERAVADLRQHYRETNLRFRACYDTRPEFALFMPKKIEDKTLLLEFCVVDNRTTLLFALSKKDGLKTFELPGSARLETLAQNWTASLTSLSRLATIRIDRPKQADRLKYLAAQEPSQVIPLSRTLLAPLEKAGYFAPGRYSHLVIIPDGPLLDVPFAALVDSRNQRLVRNYAISEEIALWIWAEKLAEKKAPKTLLCAADPFASGEQKATRDGEQLTRLPSAREEGIAVAGLFSHPTLLLGSNAQETSIKQRLSHYAFLHFATHGILDQREGLWSWLLLAGGKRRPGKLDGWSVAETPLSAQMAVLSACNSAQGNKRIGEGLQGLTWAFRAAGCPAVVGSLWAVREKATKLLMVTYYQNLKHGYAKDVALQQAMQRVLKEPGYAHPYFWAGFTLYGKTTPVSF